MSTVVELLGYAALVVAGFCVAPFLGFVVLGVVLLVVAHGLESGEPVPVPAILKARLARLRVRRRDAEATP